MKDSKKATPSKKVSKKAPVKKKPAPTKPAPKTKPATKAENAFLKIITVSQKDGVKVSGCVTGSKSLMSETLARLALNDKKMEEVLLTAFGLYMVLKKEEAKNKKKK